MNEHEEKGKGQNQKKPGPDRGDEATSSAVKEQKEERKTNRQKRAELHEALTPVIEREARQQKLREGNASPEDAHKEALAIEEDARSRSGRIREGTHPVH